MSCNHCGLTERSKLMCTIGVDHNTSIIQYSWSSSGGGFDWPCVNISSIVCPVLCLSMSFLMTFYLLLYKCKTKCIYADNQQLNESLYAVHLMEDLHVTTNWQS